MSRQSDMTRDDTDQVIRTEHYSADTSLAQVRRQLNLPVHIVRAAIVQCVGCSALPVTLTKPTCSCQVARRHHLKLGDSGTLGFGVRNLLQTEPALEACVTDGLGL